VTVYPGVGRYPVTLRALHADGAVSVEATASETTSARFSAGTDITTNTHCAPSGYVSTPDNDGNADVPSACWDDARMAGAENLTID
jgi:hypothetical protein